jgi:CheY-like chemotaxis protein
LVSASSPPPSAHGHDGKQTKSGNGPSRPPTVLVVEDEILIRMAVADYLRDCGYRVLEASSAAEAVAIFKAGEPVELVFSDVNMPGDMNGFALATWVREQHPDVKVILTSGVANTACNAQDVCANGPVLAKPYVYETLAAHIRRLLSSSSS